MPHNLNPSSALRIQASHQGFGARIEQSGTGTGTTIDVINDTSAANVLNIGQSGLGKGIYVHMFNDTSDASAVMIEQPGRGPGIKVNQSGEGEVAAEFIGGDVQIRDGNLTTNGLLIVDGDTIQSNPSLSQILGNGNDAASLKITNLAEPTNESDAATKGYVDNQMNGSTAINSIQRGLQEVLGQSGSTDNTINVVNTNKAFFVVSGTSINAGSSVRSCTADFLDSTTLRIWWTSNGNAHPRISWQVIEYN